MRISVFVLMSLLLASCGERRFPRPAFEEVDFKTTEQAKLFFKNVRSYYYEADLYSFKGAEIYRWADRNKDSTSHWIHPVLVIHLRQDQAYILTETSKAVQSNCLAYVYRLAGPLLDSMSISPASMDDHFNLNVFIYDGIEADANFYFKAHDGTQIACLTDEKLRSNYHKQLRDFLRLVGVI